MPYISTPSRRRISGNVIAVSMAPTTRAPPTDPTNPPYFSHVERAGLTRSRASMHTATLPSGSPERCEMSSERRPLHRPAQREPSEQFIAVIGTRPMHLQLFLNGTQIEYLAQLLPAGIERFPHAFL